MSSDKKKWYSLPWILVIGGAVLSPIFTDIYNKVPIYTSFVCVWDKMLNTQLKLWWVLVAITLSAFIYFLIEKRVKNKPLKAMLAYKADKFGNYIWKWDWIYNNILNRYEIKNLRPLCPQPECSNLSLEVIGSDKELESTIYICENCQLKYHIYNEDDIKEFIRTKFTNSHQNLKNAR